MAALGGATFNTNAYNADVTALAPVNVLSSGVFYGNAAFIPLKDRDNTYQYLGALTYTRGAQNIKMGLGVIRRQFSVFQSGFPEGDWIFSGYPQMAMGQFISDTGRSLTLYTPEYRIWEPSVYLQDDWHVLKGLTLNLGLRYEFFTPYSEIQGRVSTWDNDNQTFLVGNSTNAGSSPYIVYNAGNSAGVQTDYHGLAPRLGFAYSPGRSFIVRGGYGISYVPETVAGYATMKNLPFVSTTVACSSSTCTPGSVTSFSQGLPAIAPSSITSPGAALTTAGSIHLRTSYVHQFNLTLQKELSGNVLTVSYVGLLGRELAQILPDLNAAPPANYTARASSNPSAFQQARPFYSRFPNLGPINYFQTGGNSSYNALQTSLERRLRNGLDFNVNYTHEHNLDNATSISQQETGGYGLVPSQVDTRDYGNSDLDLRDHLAATASYAFPLGKKATGARALFIKGWHGNFLQVWTSGQPFTVLNSTGIGQETAASSHADRPNQVGAWKVSSPSITNFFNVSAFAAQAPGTLGTERRNQLHGPHFRHSDLSVFKTFPVRERLNVEFRAEGYNIANTANWALPGATLQTTSTFGQVTAMTYSYTPRVLQFALKLNY